MTFLDADVEITFIHGDDEASCFLKIDSNPIEVEAQFLIWDYNVRYFLKGIVKLRKINL